MLCKYRPLNILQSFQLTISGTSLKQSLLSYSRSTKSNRVAMKNALSRHRKGTESRGQGLKSHIQSPLLALKTLKIMGTPSELQHTPTTIIIFNCNVWIEIQSMPKVPFKESTLIF